MSPLAPVQDDTEIETSETIVCDGPVSQIVEEHLDEERKRWDDQRDRALREGRVELTDGQLKVCNELVRRPGGRAHVYGIQQTLATKYPESKVLSERAISNILVRLAELGLVERDPVLRPNPHGPARQEYQLADRARAIAIINAETRRRERLIAELCR